MADSATTTLRILADASQVTSAFKKVDGEWKAVADKSVKHVGTLRDQVAGIAKDLLTVPAAIAAIGAAAKIATDVMSKQADFARETNSLHLEASKAAVRAGGSTAANMAFVESNQSRLTTMQGRTAFLGALGGVSENLRSQGLQGLTQSQVNEVQRLYNRGGDVLFGDNGSDIIGALTQFGNNPQAFRVALGRRLSGRLGRQYNGGESIDSLIDKNLANLPKESVTAIKQQALAEGVNRKRLDAANQGALALDESYKGIGYDHPWWMGAAEALNSVTGGVATPLMRAGGGAGSSATTALRDISNDMKRLVISNDKMAKQSGPALPNTTIRGSDPNGSAR